MNTHKHRARFGVFEFDLKAGELREGGRTALLQEQPAQVLRMLAVAGGELVTRNEIQKTLWPNDTVVEFDHGINTAIQKLRQALGDSKDNPRYIQTVARRGYRLLLPVEWAKADADGESSDSAPVAAPLASTSLIGRKVSHYRVLEVIGAGGMGLVYSAEDLKLGRRVALKFLPEELASDSLALARFEREAQTASSLNHPNICTIYEIEEHEQQPFIVMELLEGETLRDRLARSEAKAVPLDQLLPIAIQTCDGLQAAHQKGIVHRDIKPANIFLTRQRQVKILDFGVAMLLPNTNKEVIPAVSQTPVVEAPGGPSDFRAVSANEDSPPSELASSPEPHLTRTGLAMGTVGYMSPEQVRGEKLDARTDLFSFGLVLYEMATGRHAFSGQTAEVVREEILHQPHVPVEHLNSTVPLELAAVINRALEKDREVRFQTAAELGAELKRLNGFAEPVTAASAPRYRLLLLLAATLAMVLLGLGAAYRLFKLPRIAPGKMLGERRVTHNPMENRLIGAAISPDGKYLAYTDTKGLHLSVLETGEVHDLPLPEDLREHLWAVTWFPDGEKLLFTTGLRGDYTIWTTSVFGGAPHKLSDTSGLWAMASPQGTLIAFIAGGGHQIRVMGANGEDPRTVLINESDTYQVAAWSPSGQRLAYIKTAANQSGGRIETVALNGGRPNLVTSDPHMGVTGVNLLWARDGRLIFSVDEAAGQNSSNLWGILADPETGNPSGKEGKLTNWDGLRTYSASVTSDGKHLAVVKTHSRNDVYVGKLVDSGTRLTSPSRLTVSESDDYVTGWMPDGGAVLFQSNRTGRGQIFRQAIEQETAEPLIRDLDEDDSAQASPDRQWVLYWSTDTGRDKPATTKRLLRFPMSGGPQEQILEAPTSDIVEFDCPVRASSSCVLARWELGQLIFHALDPVGGRGKQLAKTRLNPPADISIAVSPDGSQIALASQDQLPEQIRILDPRHGNERNLQLPHGLRIWSLAWSADGRAIFAAAQSTAGYLIVRIELDGKIVVLLDRGRNHWLGRAYSSPDGRHLAFTQMTYENNVWLLENF